MRVPLAWLSEFVDVDVPVEKLVTMLDMSGTSVEAVHRPGAEITGVVVAEVEAVLPHPNADNLTLVDLKLEDGGSEQVVCGARNFAVGDKVPFARVGSQLPGMDIGERKIRGVISRGMLCSSKELGVSKDHSGILVLPPDASLGDDVVALLGLSDTTLELEITPNRPDCMGMIGVAREVSALLGNPLRIPDAAVKTHGLTDRKPSVSIEDGEGCPRYLARFIEGVTIGPSPVHIAARLLAAGVRPISNVVDATNYVLLETGHPLHAFDASGVAGHRIVVRRAAARETMTTLDGVERTLNPEDLLISDPRHALAIAGVMGGSSSEVSETTTDVILESAYFDPVSIARTSRRHLLRTEASARFERGADPEVLSYAAARVAGLIEDLAGGKVGPEVDEYPQIIRRQQISFRPSRSSALLGYELETDTQVSQLRSLGINVSDTTATTQGTGALMVEVPTFRPDLQREADLIEEVARLAGLHRLPSTIPPGRSGGLDAEQIGDRRLRRTLAAVGLREAWSTSFLSERELDDMGFPPEHPARNVVRLSNPMSEDEAALRTTLLPGLLRAAARNHAQRVPSVAIYEVARVYEPTPDDLPQEAAVLAAVMSGPSRPPSWHATPEEWDFFTAKGVLETALGSLSAGTIRYSPVTGAPFHPTRAASVVVDGHPVGVVGELHPDICAGYEVPEGTVAFEVALGPAFASLKGRPKVPGLSKFPAAFMDLAIIVEDRFDAESVQAVIENVGAPEVTSVRLFDVYQGEQVEAGRRSLAYSLELRSPDRTLTDADTTEVRSRILAALRERVGAELRGQ